MAALNLEEQHTWGLCGVSEAYTAFRMMTGVETVNGKTVFVTLSALPLGVLLRLLKFTLVSFANPDTLIG